MLVLGRFVRERIAIGPEIVIVVTQIRGDQVHLGIEAPRHLRISRLEPSAAHPGKEAE